MAQVRGRLVTDCSTAMRAKSGSVVVTRNAVLAQAANEQAGLLTEHQINDLYER